MIVQACLCLATEGSFHMGQTFLLLSVHHHNAPYARGWSFGKDGLWTQQIILPHAEIKGKCSTYLTLSGATNFRGLNKCP